MGNVAPGPPSRIAIARLIAPFGINGYAKVRVYAPDPKRLKNITEVYVGPSPNNVRLSAIDDVLVQQNGVMVKLAAVPDRTAVERLIGQFLFVEETKAIRPKHGQYFVHDIIGCAVECDDGKRIGTVTDVGQFPAQDVWIIDHNARSVMIPAVKEFIKSVNIARRVIVVQNVEGFLEE